MLVFTVQLISGISLLVDYFVPLALVALAAVLVNILNYHITMDMSSVPPALVATVLWIIAAQNYRGNFRGLLARKAESPTA